MYVFSGAGDDGDDPSDNDDVDQPGLLRASKRIASSSFAVPHPSSPQPKSSLKGKKKTTKTTTVETTTIRTKKKITTKIVREDGATDSDDGPRRSRRNRTDVRMLRYA